MLCRGTKYFYTWCSYLHNRSLICVSLLGSILTKTSCKHIKSTSSEVLFSLQRTKFVETVIGAPLGERSVDRIFLGAPLGEPAAQAV